MEDFKTYLIKKEYSNSTINEIERNVVEFINYCKNSDIEKENVNFQTVLAFIETLQKRGVKPQTVNIRLSSIKKYLHNFILLLENKRLILFYWLVIFLTVR
jgi:site-specific recombinase XerD